MAGKTTATAPATYWATTGVECGDWRCEAGHELVGYPDVLDIKGLLEIAAITTAPVVVEPEVTRG